MKKIATIVLTLLTSQGVAFSQEGSFERKPYTLKLSVDKETYYSEELKSSPYMYPDNTLQLYPEEKVYVEVEVQSDTISRMRVVPEIHDSSKTLIIRFWQESEKKKHKTMMLKIENPLAYHLHYKAVIYLFNHKEWVETSTIPVYPGISSFESWPDLITSIALHDWKLEK